MATKPSAEGTLDVRSALTSHLFTKTECALIYADLGVFDNATARAEEALHVARVAGLLYFRALAEMSIGAVHVSRGDSSIGIPFLQRSLQLSNDSDFPGAIINAAPALGHAYNLTHRADEAVGLLARAWSLAESGGFLSFGAACLIHLADAYSLTGQNATALATIDQALALVRESGFRAREAWALHIQGKILGRASKLDYVSAAQAHQAAFALARELGMRPLEAQCHCALGELARKAGETLGAQEQFSVAASMFREMGMQFPLERVEAALREVSTQ
jgi:tetratricopeptide (TPR) repeat protein